jgi:tetratricopeptide (TPR) repeat protein/membrane protease YdiL (CAAX protease family)
MAENLPAPDQPMSSAFRAGPPPEEVVLLGPEHAAPPPVPANLPAVVPVVPGPGFWAAVGWLLLLVVAAGAIGVFLLAALRPILSGPVPPPVAIVAAFTGGILVAALLLAGGRLGRQARRALALRRLGLLHGVLVFLLAPPLLVVNLGLAEWAQRGLQAVGARGAAPAAAGKLSLVHDLYSALDGQPLLLVLLIACLCPGVAEEIFFRGFLGRGLVARFGLVRGVLFTSSLFGLMHVEPAHVCVTTALGVVLHLVYLSTRSLLAPMLLHTLNNFAVFGLHRCAPDWLLGELFPAGEVHLGPFLAALAALAGLGFVFYRTRVRWVLPNRRIWDAGYLTAEMPPAVLRAVLRRRSPGWAGGLGVLGGYLLFGGACTYTALMPHAAAAYYCQRGERAYDRDALDEAMAEFGKALGFSPQSAEALDGRGRARGLKGDADGALQDFTEAIRLEPDAGHHHANRGWAHWLRREFTQAERDCDEALRLDPTHGFAADIGGRACKEMASQAYDRDQFDESIRLAGKALRLKPGFAEAHNVRGMSLGMKGSAAEALRDFNEAVRLQPRFADYYANRAWAHNLRHEYAEARRDCDRALQLNRNCVFARQTRARALAGLGRQAYDRDAFDEAVALCTEALGLDPTVTEAYETRGMARGMKRDTEAALEDFNEAIRLVPRSARLHAYRGWAHNLRREFTDGLRDAEEALRLDPKCAFAITVAVQAYQELGGQAYQRDNFDVAIARFNKAIRLKPDEAGSYNGRGMTLGMKGDAAAALRDFNEAIRLQPGVADYYANRAWAHNLRGAYCEAVRDCDEALRRNRDCAFAYSNRGWARDELGEKEAALTDLTEALRRNRDDVPGHFRRGILCAGRGDFAEAVRSFSEAIRLESDNAGYYYRRANAYIGTGDTARAVADLTKALELLPTYFEALRTRSALYGGLGRREEARADLDAVLGLYPNDVDTLWARGRLSEQEGHHAEALADFTAGLRQRPKHLGCLADRAWLLATCPQEEHRDGKQAVADARRACDLTDWLDAGLLATLAAAHAACEEYDEAVTWERRAIRLAGNAPGDASRIRLSFYEAGLPFGAPQR